MRLSNTTAFRARTSEMPIGAYVGLPADEYHRAPGWNHSVLKRFDAPATPAHVLASLTDPDDEPSESKILGTLCHQAILEPEATPPMLAIKPEGMKFSTTEGKAWRKAAEEAGNLIITEEAWTSLQCMTRSVRENPVCQRIFGAGMSELSVWAPLEVDGLTITRKVRFDWVPTGNTLVDVKTTLDASPTGFADAVARFSYHSQAAWYLDTWNDAFPEHRRDCFVFVAVEKSAPYLVALYQLSPDAIELGRQLNASRLSVLRECIRSGQWPGYSREIETLSLPAWYLRKQQAPV